MLTSMRKGAGSWVAKIFLGLLVASFAIWGIGDYVTGRANVTVAEVGNAEISGVEYEEELRRQMRRLQIQFGQAIDREQARAFGLEEAALQQLIGRLVVDQGMAELGLGVPDGVVAEDIKNNPAFRNSLGQFDEILFRQLMAQNGYSERSYVALRRQEIARAQLIGSVGEGIDAAPGVLVDRLYRYRLEQRLADYIVLPNERITDIPEPDGAALAKYHQDNAARFTAPEFRAISYVTLTPADLIGQVEVDAEDLRLEYDSRIDEFDQKETREVGQLVFQSEAEAQKAFDRLQAGEDFAAVAKDMLDVEPSDLSLGRVSTADLPAELAGPAFAIGEGEASSPVKTAFGWHVLRATGIQPGRTQTFEEVRDQLRQDVALRLAIDEILDLTADIEDALAGGASLPEAASIAGRAVERIATVDSAGRGPDGTAIADLPPQREFLPTAFTTDQDAELELVQSDDDSYFLVRIDEITPSALRPLDQVREQVAQSWRAAQRSKANAEQAQSLVERINGGESTADLARELRLPLSKSEPIVRGGPSGTDTAIPPALQSALFNIEEGKAATAANPLDGTHVVAVLTGIRAAEPGSDRDAAKSLGRQLTAGMADDLLRQYQAALEQQIGVKIDRGALAAIAQQN